MTRHAHVELRDLIIPVAIGTYGPSDVVPDAHLLDMTLTIAPDLVQIGADEMALVFDYDPLIAQIVAIAQSQKFETQEYLIALIAKTCAVYAPVMALDICLKKRPVLAGSGSLGVRLVLGADDLANMREAI